MIFIQDIRVHRKYYKLSWRYRRVSTAHFGIDDSPSFPWAYTHKPEAGGHLLSNSRSILLDLDETAGPGSLFLPAVEEAAQNLLIILSLKFIICVLKLPRAGSLSCSSESVSILTWLIQLFTRNIEYQFILDEWLYLNLSLDICKVFYKIQERVLEKEAGKERVEKGILTNHSWWPWELSWWSFFTAITVPVPGLAAVNECSSIHPLKTQPKPPSPNTLSGRKFLVAAFNSLKKKLFRFEDCRISPCVRGVEGTVEEETLLLDPLLSFPLFLAYFVFDPE